MDALVTKPANTNVIPKASTTGQAVGAGICTVSGVLYPDVFVESKTMLFTFQRPIT